MGTYDSSGVASWYESGVQVLDAAGWRPDCAVGSGLNVAKRLPPKDTRGSPLIEHTDLLKYATSGGVPGYQGWLDDPSGGTGLTTFVFFQDGFRASCAPQIDSVGLPGAQGWIFGADEVSEEPPTFLTEGGLLLR